jgi:2-oxoglutarate dehydrogenase E1 component
VEALAFASLLVEGTSVRLTGQDAERGTFGHRNAVVHDVKTGATYTPLAHLKEATASFEIYNSPLTEMAVMGFEYGFSVSAPDTLALWEAQYGDFVNVAQPIIDQYLVADRAKWSQDSGLVLLLPHGYEGGGPEHSSARLERFLQLCAEGNMVVANPSTPAQYFHILRRQAKRTPRRPLVLMQPKSLLRLPAAASRLTDLAEGTFQPAIAPSLRSGQAQMIRRVVLCTGKLYYDLTAQSVPDSVAVVRVEELYPWPADALADVLRAYANAREIVWAQEEPQNMGAWTYAAPRLRALADGRALTYVGRPERASPAEGYEADHKAEQARIVAETLAVQEPSRERVGA